MSWEFEYDTGDGFVPMMFGAGVDDEFDDAAFGEESFDSGPAFFQTSPAPPQSILGWGGRPVDAQESRLVDENKELRATAMSLKEKFAQMTSLNEKLKGQLEECRSNFRNVMFSGFANSGK